MKKIIVIDDDVPLLSVMKKLIELKGHQVTAGSSLASIQNLDTDLSDYKFAFLDINLGTNSPSGLDAYDWLLKRRFPGKVIFLTGHAGTHPLVVEALKVPGVRLLEKPTTASSIISAIE